MTPAARIQAVIEVLADLAARGAPAERAIAAYMRARRYMGAKDRRAIADLSYDILRHQARLGWWLTRAGVEASERATMIAYLALVQGRAGDEIAAAFNGGRYAPAPLDEQERALVSALRGRPVTSTDQPEWVRAEIPQWLWAEVVRGFGAGALDEAVALAEPAHLDLRVNTLATTRGDALAALAKDGIEAVPTPISPVGMRVTGRRNVLGSAPFRDGLVEVQDEGSQIVALLVGARPGMAVADVCAGGGGKTLALAAVMENRGRLLALDVDPVRLRRAGPRLIRAGADLVECRVWNDGVADEAGAFDRVLVDAPCSGSGAWRRAPDARWRLTPARLAEHQCAQDEALDRAVDLVRPGGWLVYVTCSILPSENEDVVARFLARQTEFKPVHGEEAWQGAFGADAPQGAITPEGWITLTPRRHGTDGFFAAIMKRA